MSNNTEKVIQIISEILARDDVDANSSRDNLDDWDSLAYMEIASCIEQKMGIEVSADNIQKFNSVISILELLEK